MRVEPHGSMVDGGNGKLYSRDHPHEIHSGYVMTYAQIRYWFQELSQNADYGWTDGGVRGLERALGLNPGGIHRRLSTAWIWPREQAKFTHRIRDIVEGRVVPMRKGHRVDGVFVDPPRPPVLGLQPLRFRALLPVGKTPIRLVAAPLVMPSPRLPDFKGAFKNVPFWDPDKKRAGKKPAT